MIDLLDDRPRKTLGFHTPREKPIELISSVALAPRNRHVFGNKIVGYSIDSRTKSSLAVRARENAVAMWGHIASCVVHSDRGSLVSFVAGNFSEP